LKRRATRRQSVPAVLAFVASLGSVVSCYRAEIDLSLFQDAAAGRAGAGAGGTASSDPPAGGAGAAGASGAGSSGGPPDVACDSEWLPTPDDATCDLLGFPSKAECAEQPADGWRGCYNGGCSICTVDGRVPGFPYYLDWHPCCQANDTCSNHMPVMCNAMCPAPTEHDRVPRCKAPEPNPG
jgi:hypothetical protein